MEVCRIVFQSKGKTGNPRIAQIYAYVVSFAALIALVIMTVIGLVGVAKVAMPEYSLSKYEYLSMQRETAVITLPDAGTVLENSAVAEYPQDELVADSAAPEMDVARVPVSRVKQHPQLSSEDILSSQRHDGINNLIHMFATWLVCIPVLWIHFAWAARLGAREARYRSNEQRYPRNRPSRPRPPKSG